MDSRYLRDWQSLWGLNYFGYVLKQFRDHVWNSNSREGGTSVRFWSQLLQWVTSCSRALGAQAGISQPSTARLAQRRVMGGRGRIRTGGAIGQPPARSCSGPNDISRAVPGSPATVLGEGVRCPSCGDRHPEGAASSEPGLQFPSSGRHLSFSRQACSVYPTGSAQRPDFFLQPGTVHLITLAHKGPLL